MSTATPTLNLLLGPAPSQATDKPAINPWIVAVTVTLATFMEILDTSIANVALPHIAGGLSSGLDESTWVLTSYLVANAVVLPLSAFLSRVFGRKNYYMSCVLLFTISSFLCGLAPTLGMLIFFRVLQGLAGGGLAPSEQAILVDTFPPAKRAAAFGLYSMAIVIAPALGPTLGGWITDTFNWRWVFYINVPVGILSLVLTHFLVHDSPRMKEQMQIQKETKQRVDYIGILLIALGLGCLEVVLDKGQRDDWFESPFICCFFAVSMMSLFSAIYWELTVKNPVVDLSLLKERNFALANGFYFLFGFLILGSTELIPQMVQTLFGYTASQAGWALAPGAMVVVALAPMVVKLVPIIGAPRMIFFSFAVQSLALWMYTNSDLTTDYWSFVVPRMVQGFGMAFLFVPVSSLAYSYLPRSANDRASSLTNLFRNLGMSFGIAFVTTVQAQRAQLHRAYLSEHMVPQTTEMNTPMQSMQSMGMQGGMSMQDAQNFAFAQMNRMLDNQSNMIAYVDTFWLMSWIAVIAVVGTFLIKPFKPAGPGGH